jgi:hypothetical protein
MARFAHQKYEQAAGKKEEKIAQHDSSVIHVLAC